MWNYLELLLYLCFAWILFIHISDDSLPYHTFEYILASSHLVSTSCHESDWIIFRVIQKILTFIALWSHWIVERIINLFFGAHTPLSTLWLYGFDVKLFLIQNRYVIDLYFSLGYLSTMFSWTTCQPYLILFTFEVFLLICCKVVDNFLYHFLKNEFVKSAQNH